MKILITGASSGIGFLTGITLAYRNHEVIMCTHTEEQLYNLNIKLNELNLDIKTIKLDLINKEDINKFKSLNIDVLINHAAMGMGGSIIDINLDEVKELYEVNFFNSFELVKIFCNNLIKQNRKGKVIITSSLAGVVPFEFLGGYCSSKAAITMMARCLKKELKSINSNIQVSLIQPRAYKTGFNEFMIDKVSDSINYKSPFFYKRDQILRILRLKFNIIEQRKLTSIVCQIIKCVEIENNNFIYSTPIFQTFIKKLYSCLFY